MGIREEIGGRVEDMLNKALDNNLKPEVIKEKLHEQVDKLVDQYIGDLKHKIKADVIDLIDGENDIEQLKFGGKAFPFDAFFYRPNVSVVNFVFLCKFSGAQWGMENFDDIIFGQLSVAKLSHLMMIIFGNRTIF